MQRLDSKFALEHLGKKLIVYSSERPQLKMEIKVKGFTSKMVESGTFTIKEVPDKVIVYDIYERYNGKRYVLKNALVYANGENYEMPGKPKTYLYVLDMAKKSKRKYALRGGKSFTFCELYDKLLVAMLHDEHPYIDDYETDQILDDAYQFGMQDAIDKKKPNAQMLHLAHNGSENSCEFFGLFSEKEKTKAIVQHEASKMGNSYYNGYLFIKKSNL